MKATILTTSLLFAMLVFTAFAVTKEVKPKIKQINNLLTGSISEYAYRPDGRVGSIRKPKGANGKYEYAGNMIIKTMIDSVAHKYLTDTIKLNKKGYAVFMYNQFGDSLWSTGWYSYDTSGHVTDERFFDEKSNTVNTIKMTYAGGNEVNLRQNWPFEGLSSERYFTYYSDKLNTIGNENMGMSFLGADSKDLVKAETYIQRKVDTIPYFYNYHFDPKGRVNIKAVYQKGKLVDSTAYSYY